MRLATLACLLWAMAAPRAGPADSSDVLYEALFGDPEVVDASVLLAAPGRFVGRAVLTRGRLVRMDQGATMFAIVAGEDRVLLRLEPDAAAMVSARGPAWEGETVEVVGFFHRGGLKIPMNAYALRAWSVRPAGPPPRIDHPGATDALSLSLEQLVYGAGRHDGQLVRVRGTYRGSNLHNDLPEATRQGPRDWVLKDGYFAVWVTGREARGDGWDLTRRTRSETDTALEVVGVPRFWGGVIRLAARAVEVSSGPGLAATSRPLGAADTSRDPSVVPRVTFAYPVRGEALDAPGHMIIQFSNSMDPIRLETRVRVRYERRGAAMDTPQIHVDYRDRYRVLVLTPETPPPPGTDVVVELLDGIIDVEGHALVRRSAPGGPDETSLADHVVEQVRFRSNP